MTANKPVIAMDRLAQALAETPAVAFAVLIGSRANHTANDGSDWDIAVFWKPAAASADTAFARLGQHESLRRRLAQCLNVAAEKMDLIDLASAGLTMKAQVAEEGTILNLNDELAWAYFQTTTWRELEDHYWDRAHAA